MNTTRVLTNETCDHRCSFCHVRRDAERLGVAGNKSIRKRIDTAHAAGVREIVLTGGEPLLRRDLVTIVEYAARRAPRVAVETNACSLTFARARELAQAGLTGAVVHVTAWGPEADAITGVPGAFQHMRAGIDALQAAGIDVDLSVPLTVATRETAALIPGLVVAAGISVGQVRIVPVVEAPDPRDCLALPALTRAVISVARAARQAGVFARLAVEPFVPPCVFPDPAQVAHLYAMTPGGAERPRHQRQPACSGCMVEDRCPGVSDALGERRAEFAVRPLTSDRVRRRLSIISSVPEQIERELVARELCRRTDGTAIAAHTVRINFHCNQACHFCFVSTHLPPAEHEAIVAAIEEIGALGGLLALSGGEPTLNPRLLDYVRMGREAGVAEIELQTNATRLGDSEFAQALANAGVTQAIVSLHGATAATSDAITDAPGTFEQTLRGIDALTSTTIDVRLNYVFCEANRNEFGDYVRMVAARWPGVMLTISFVASSSDVVPRTRALMPRYADVMPSLAAGVREARAFGLRVSGFESMCGLPLCLVPEDVTRYAGLAAIPDGLDRGEFLKPEACSTCDARDQCFGIRRGYAALHGTDELQPIRYADGAPPAAR